MKKIVIALPGALFFLLDWAALHDIIKGGETSYNAEYAIIGLSIIYFLSAGYLLFKKKLQKKSIHH